MVTASADIEMSVKGMFIAINLCVMVKKAEELKWMTEKLSTTSCEGQDHLLMWNYSTEVNESVKQLQWFYNNTRPICYYSDGFHVSPLYEGRIEWNGKMGILLKKVSSVDTGKYTLYPKIAEEKTKNTQTIFLTVYESPTYQCKPNITIHSKSVVSCSTNSCGRPEAYPEWRIFGKRDPVGNGTYLTVNSSWNDELLLCCLDEPSMKCHTGDQFQFCTPTPISPTNKDRKDNSTNTSGLEIYTAPNFGNKQCSAILVAMTTVSALLVAVIMSFIGFLWYCWKKQKLFMKHHNAAEEHDIIELQNTHMLTDQELHQENLTHRFQLVNNFNIDSDVFKIILDSQRTVKAEMQALKTENEKLKRLLYLHQNSLQSEEDEGLLIQVDSFTRETNDNAGTITVHCEGFLT